MANSLPFEPKKSFYFYNWVLAEDKSFGQRRRFSRRSLLAAAISGFVVAGCQSKGGVTPKT